MSTRECDHDPAFRDSPECAAAAVMGDIPPLDEQFSESIQASLLAARREIIDRESGGVIAILIGFLWCLLITIGCCSTGY